ncbi:hypothetical protein BpHYR1_005181 [Brachionus plicatilis]|uniref:Uncharacterized protein n=1 Tax=Brachionus plicatilis TaxID=10195 RepID=A0A3M7RQ14_BRAPC|nr:hypothetical protein BpHYR1_005181 [Brachionus plicatilis]
MWFSQNIEGEMQVWTDTPIYPLKNSVLFDTYKESEESAKGDTRKRKEQRTIVIQSANESSSSREWSFKPTISTPMQDFRTC